MRMEARSRFDLFETTHNNDSRVDKIAQTSFLSTKWQTFDVARFEILNLKDEACLEFAACTLEGQINKLSWCLEEISLNLHSEY